MDKTSYSTSPLAKGLAWLKAQHDQLIELYYQELQRLNQLYNWHMPDEMKQVIAQSNVDRLIGRLEGRAVDTEDVKKVYAENIRRGAQIQHGVLVMDSLLAVLTTKVTAELKGQPEIAQALLEKAAYFTALVKTTMATSQIEQSIKPTSSSEIE